MVRILPWREAPWRVGLETQLRLAAEVGAGGQDALALFTHPPTVTLGKSTAPEETPGTAPVRRSGAALMRADRGGQATWHGPGQIVGYPVIGLRRRGLSPADLVARVLGALATWVRTRGLPARAAADPPGVWVGEGKVASLGMRLAKGVTGHGFALNLDTPRDAFDGISPCGLDPAKMSSLAALGAAPLAVAQAAAEIGAAVAEAL